MFNTELEEIDEILETITRLQAVNYLQTLINSEMEGIEIKDYGYTPKNATNYLLWEQEDLLKQLEQKTVDIFGQNPKTK